MGSIIDLKNLLDEEIELILSTDYEIVVTETMFVPTIDDSLITYPNLETMQQKVKLIETCVLYIDIRRSTELNLTHRKETVTKLYSAFIRSMVKAAEQYGGKVRGIVGDRVMVVFDSYQCCTNALNTAILMHSISEYLLNKHFNKNDIQCGIGIDYGKMLVSKNGIIKQGAENISNKSLVWLGKPANVASKLTDAANKITTISQKETIIEERHEYKYLKQTDWYKRSITSFLNNLENTYSSVLKHKDPNFSSFIHYQGTSTSSFSTPPILFTADVFEGLKMESPEDKALVNSWWKEQTQESLSNFAETIYGGDIYFEFFENSN
ncbi:adenylate/guanylate cyclase domain-containing protein [Paenibacillus sp. FSL H7-0716]|uniref:Guanylate cyclase domain-containing protein n=1 Tax=Paenibacillus odorifer TaxID=189426 RepID=A0AB36J6C9_9BACL|nr:adenylate/guanylate cyclase domain-containing protein [Paenibacillus odorifer]OME08888.1 hypothetical protein BSK60_28575 [Paenibacillus odorifer]OME13868.1 hypothetical protein BSK47_24785 [Paenibacillus odorifer]